jgi:phosphoserine aminotransferase
MKKHNFSAGPAILPAAVIEQAAAAVLDFNGIGFSLLEISHRSPEFIQVMEEAEALVIELLQLPEQYKVLFLSGGASSQFFMTAMNLLEQDGHAAYIDTGTWSSKAIKEARLFGNVDVIASSKDKQYTYIPKDYLIPEGAAYLHLTSNNTIYGTQFHAFPTTQVPMVCDMSSDIFSRPIDISGFGLIYAGAQKNLGPAGVTLVVVNEELLGKVNRVIPSMLNYKNHIEQQSSYNTPPVFPIYVTMLTLRWIKAMGGLAAMEHHNRAKAALIYDEIDRNPLFKGVAQSEDRSLMNATFVTGDPAHEKPFLALAKEAGCDGIKGHRSVGGFRASIYNAMEQESVLALVQAMQHFEKVNG